MDAVDESTAAGSAGAASSAVLTSGSTKTSGSIAEDAQNITFIHRLFPKTQ